ncbi:MAG TPA: hypothetical protein DC047_17190 [Blastocatellia bacterium]|nr:hypothetical protein [Blastocatellia bacterium]
MSDPSSASTSASGSRRPISPKRRIRIFRILLSLTALFFGLAIAEGSLRFVERMKTGDRLIEDKLIQDPVLGFKLAPNTQGHDANGFRNATVPQQVDVVCLGDSQTWGVNVGRQDAWPEQLSRMSGRRVYSMALGGFGPVQYQALMPQALHLSPKLVIVGLYFGNDIYDAYHMAYQYESHRSLRSTSAGDDLSVDTVGSRARALSATEKQFHANFGRSSISGWSFWLREHLALGRLLNRAGLWPGSADVDYEIDKRWAAIYPDQGAVCEEPGVETVLTPAYRLTGLDTDDPRIVEGLRITKELLAQMQREIDGSQVKLMVLLIPTKETVYATARPGSADSNSTYKRVVEMESQVRAEILSACQAERIQCVDVLPRLSAAVAQGERLYPTTTESHPNARGYSVIAAAANENLGKLGL